MYESAIKNNMGHAQLSMAIYTDLFSSRQILSNLKQTVDAGWSDVTTFCSSVYHHFNLLFTGALLQQIIKEAVLNTRDSTSPKVIVRIGTPVSVAALLAACVAPPPRLPDPGAALLFELHEKLPSGQGKKEQNALSHGQRFGFKVLSLYV